MTSSAKRHGYLSRREWTPFARTVATGTCLAILAAGLSVTFERVLAQEAGSPASVQVQVVRATNACFSSTVRVTGFLVARQEAMVSLDAPGLRVTEVLVGEGDRVTNGQTLVRLTRQSGEGPDSGAAARSGPTTLKSPAAGMVTRSTAVVGATASPFPSEPLFRIAVDNEIELEAEVPSIHVPELSPGQTARVQVEGSRELSGRVRLAPGEIDRRTQLGRARVSLERDPSLKLGMFARAEIEAERSCGISVPRSAVQYRTEGPRVQIVRQNLVETRLVRIGFHSDLTTEIREGLREGDMVVANAGSSLRDGDKVTPVGPDSARMGQR